MRLILINGPCGVGKSTAAQEIHKKIPLSVYVEISKFTKLVSGYKEQTEKARALAMKAAFGFVDACLVQGQDVVVDKMISDEGDVKYLLALGEKHGADVYEYILWADQDTVLERAGRDGFPPTDLLTPERCVRFWNEMKELKEKRKGAILIDATALNSEGVVQQICKGIGL